MLLWACAASQAARPPPSPLKVPAFAMSQSIRPGHQQRYCLQAPGAACHCLGHIPPQQARPQRILLGLVALCSMPPQLIASFRSVHVQVNRRTYEGSAPCNNDNDGRARLTERSAWSSSAAACASRSWAQPPGTCPAAPPTGPTPPKRSCRPHACRAHAAAGRLHAGTP